MPPYSAHDTKILRDLALRVREGAESPENAERRRLWYAHDAGRGERPLILTEAKVAFHDLPASRLQCEDPAAHATEDALRYSLFLYEDVRDDHVLEPWCGIRWAIRASTYGVEPKVTTAERVSGNVSSRHWEPPITDLTRDFHLLKPRTFEVNRQATLDSKARLEELFDGILGVQLRGLPWWTTGMTSTAINLVGLENLMLSMCTDPDGLHRLMGFLRDDMMAFIDWLEAEDLLELNNANDYIGSGSMGYTADLPQSENGQVQTSDLWVLSESQETVQVSPQMFEEFVFQYQLPVAERFGKLYYGCCEPVHLRWDILKKFPNLHRVSISPWCDQEYMAAECGRRYAFSRKPNPTLVSTRDFDEQAIRDDIETTCRIARDCNVELVLKDVHTLSEEPHRIARWVQLAREASEQALSMA
jgi:hypothetical protein